MFWVGLEKIHEWKEAYFMLCEDTIHTVFACDSFFTHISGTSIIIAELFSTLSCTEVEVVDQNLFTALCIVHEHKISLPFEEKFSYLPHIPNSALLAM